MKNPTLTLLLLHFLACNYGFGQTIFWYDDSCPATSERVHVRSDGSAFVLVEEACDGGSHQWMVCEPVINQLLPVVAFTNERLRGFYSDSEGFHTVGLAQNSYVFRSFDNDANVQSVQTIELSPSAMVVCQFVSDNELLLGFYEFVQGTAILVIARFAIATGEMVESIVFEPSIFVGDTDTQIIAIDNETLYIGISCELRITINPTDLSDHSVAELPINEFTGEAINPCGLPHVMRDSSNSGSLFTSLFVGDDFDPNYTLNFSADGSYTIDELWLADEHVAFDFQLDNDGMKYIIAGSAFSMLPDRDLVVYKMDESNMLIDSVHIDAPQFSHGWHKSVIHGSTLHLFGWSRPLGQEEGSIATYITVDLNSFGTGVAEVNRRTPVFIHTDEEFGFSDTSIVTRFELYDLTGKIIHAASDAVRLQKSDFLPGTYVVKAYTTESVHSYRVMVH